MAQFIRELLFAKINTKSDINEHLHTLYNYSRECNSIVECGVRSAVSTWAFLYGLLNNNSNIKELICVDIEDIENIDIIKTIAEKAGINLIFKKHNSATININIPERISEINTSKVDLLFIDTWHVYGHLKRELEHHHENVNKYIIMHDTELDGEFGESIRCNSSISEQSEKTGYAISEIVKGLKPAINEFVTSHLEWVVHEHFEYCNGLTILKRQY